MPLSLNWWMTPLAGVDVHIRRFFLEVPEKA